MITDGGPDDSIVRGVRRLVVLLGLVAMLGASALVVLGRAGSHEHRVAGTVPVPSTDAPTARAASGFAPFEPRFVPDDLRLFNEMDTTGAPPAVPVDGRSVEPLPPIHHRAYTGSRGRPSNQDRTLIVNVI